MAPAAAAAIRMGMSIGLDLDVDDATDEHEADEHHETAEAEDDEAKRQPKGFRWLLEHRIHKVGRGHEEEPGQADRQEADDIARKPLLGRQGPDLPLDAYSFAD